MNIYGSYSAESPCMIDYMEFGFRNLPEKFVPEDLRGSNDLVLSVFWDESDWLYDEDSKAGHFRLKGISINDVYANGHAEAFRDAAFDAMQVYGAPLSHFRLTQLEICDGEKTLNIPEGGLHPRELYYESE